MSGPNQLMRPISLISLFFILPLLPTITTAADLKSDGASLLSLRSALGGGRSLLWNTTTSPCSWTGVVCNSTRVTELHLPGRSLSGQIPAGVIGNLTDLTFLSLRYNSLRGSIPSDITSCKQLQYIYLQGNRFTGEIPAAIFSFSNLIRLNLANNNFSGVISPSFNNLTHLASLYLENNRLTGEIPELNIPSLNLFNVSKNLLHGSIPSKLAIMPASAFEGNSLCGAPLSSCSNNSKKKLSGGAIAGIVIGAVVALIVILFLIIIMCCRRSKEKKEGALNVASAKAMDVEMAEEKAMADKERRSLGVEQSAAVAGAVKEGAKGGGIDKSLVFIGNYVPSRVYDLDDLLRASAEVLGKGTYGTTYKASLEIGITVAVKRLKDVIVKEKELKGKMEEIGRMNHENLVPLKAYHCSPNEKLIVSDYMPMGSLSALLHGNRGGGRTPLNWETRSMIALGAARGITYIHSQSPTTSHGNIKSSNILLSNSYQARVSDFGLAQLATPTTPPNRIAGYRAPEVTDSRKVSQKADVYSFGVFLLELLTGKAPTHTHTHTLLNEQGVDLPRWVQSVVQQEWSAEVFDEELLRYQNVEEEMVQLLQLAVDCTAHYPDTRPSMAEVTSRIEQICGSTSRREQELFEDIVDDGENQQSSP